MFPGFPNSAPMMPDPVAELVIFAQERYEANGLPYHNWDHVVAMMAMLLDWNPLLSEEDRIALEMAILFHDVVYDPQRSDNEERSAIIATHQLSRTKYSHLSDQVASAILATAHHHPTNELEKLLVDLDLAILASDQYDEYTQAIRKEFSFVSDDDFKKGRGRFLEAYLAKEPLFWTTYGTALTAKAKANMEHEIQQLTR